jgi:Cu(I)/Ag(I) efflux system membrane protein CusA/SilA
MSASTEEPKLIERLIAASARNKFLIVIFTIFGIAAGVFALQRTPLDAIPDLSDVQVIVYTDWEGRSPDLLKTNNIRFQHARRSQICPRRIDVRKSFVYGSSRTA